MTEAEYSAIIERVIRAIRPEITNITITHDHKNETIQAVIDGVPYTHTMGSDDCEFVFCASKINPLIFTIPSDYE